MKALILAGGKGSRLRPYTTVIPKPLMPVGEVPILEIILRQLKHAGISEVTLAVGYLSHLFHAFFGDGSSYGIKVSYVHEEKPLGTAGPIALAIDQLGDDFLVMNGDVLTTMDFAKLCASHQKKKGAATIAVNRRQSQIDFGVIEVDSEKRLRAYIEKPAHQFLVSMGVNVINAKAARKFLTLGQPLDIPQLMMQMRASGETIHCFDDPCYWLDIGRVDDYQIAQEIFEARKNEFLPSPKAKAA